MKISVIVAAYNAEKYLSETLESLLHQTIDNYEVIVVNDGSVDSTEDILAEYREKYENLCVINKENGGPSSARNVGLDIAQGDYIFFFFFDDLLELDALECLYDTAINNRADLVIAKYDIFDLYKVLPVNNINGLVIQDTIDKYDMSILWTFSLWNKLYKRELIEQYHFRFPPISYSEDGAFLMEYVYHARKITGLDKVVTHYRRMHDGGNFSITASVSPSKIRDYITAHHMILDSAEKSILKDHPEYGSMEEARKQDLEIHKYFNEIIKKELQVLLNQFYIKFWELEQATVQMIVDEIEAKIRILDMKSISMLQDAHPDFTLFHLDVCQEDMLDRAYFTVALYGENENSEDENSEDFLECLKTIVNQNLIGMKIIVPQGMRERIEKAELLRGNIFFADVSSERELFYEALDHAKTPYITFCNAKVVYANNAFRYIFKRFIKSPADFMAELIYHRNYVQPQPVFLNSVSLDSLKKGMEYNPYLCFDHTLANKFFRVDFLREQRMEQEKDIVDYVGQFFREGYYAFYNDAIVFYEDKENTFLDFISTPETRAFAIGYLRDDPVTLNSPDIIIDQAESLRKLQMMPNKKWRDKLLRKAVSYLRKRDLKDQVLFFSIRKDGALEGNAKALYPYINGKKVVCAKRLPHNWLTQLRMFEKVITSKVIVTDDYVKYLRHFPVRPDQRVIQLWHACGAFKKFGQRGTNMSLATDAATHAQYNMVSVSGSAIRTIYADAFHINVKKVKALGCPRTDVFFNQTLIEETRTKIYKKHPELEGRFIIIYAPTFRDIGNDRTKFHPEIDFDKLSRELLSDQEFIICPHPLMKNKIVPKEYPNIHVMRDFSTNELMFISDMLITDYSSVIFEYALLKKPMAFFCYDLAIYSRGFYLNYPEDLPGTVYETQEDLTEYLTNPEKHVLDEKYDTFVQNYMSACDGHSSERIAKLINDYMEGN